MAPNGAVSRKGELFINEAACDGHQLTARSAHIRTERQQTQLRPLPR